MKLLGLSMMTSDKDEILFPSSFFRSRNDMIGKGNGLTPQTHKMFNL